MPSRRDAKIAELAYYKAESRGFEPGHELEDWYAAETEPILAHYRLFLRQFRKNDHQVAKAAVDVIGLSDLPPHPWLT
jgi:Protein of unknown function (DUF2934)